MNLATHIRTRRPGFTLVELLIVIAIIAVLVGLLSAAVMRALGTGNQTANTADIRKMTAAVQAFQMHYKVTHIPSRIRLCKYLAHYDLQNASNPDYQLNKDSHAFLMQVWPRLEWTKVVNNQPAYVRIDWNGLPLGGPDFAPVQSPPQPSKANVFDLDGGQCLVFFLGGIPQTVGAVGTQGFSTNSLNPVVGTERVAPFFEFKSNRLRTPPLDGFYHYLDAYGVRPYAYFSSYGKRNGYNKYYPFPALRRSDCSNLSDPQNLVYGLPRGVWPLAEQMGTSPRYLNPESFQIISAGADETFGTGTDIKNYEPTTGNWLGDPLWSLREPGPIYRNSALRGGHDDQSNFHSLLLGVQAE